MHVQQTQNYHILRTKAGCLIIFLRGSINITRCEDKLFIFKKSICNSRKRGFLFLEFTIQVFPGKVFLNKDRADREIKF